MDNIEIQGPYRSQTTGKVMEFELSILRPGKVMDYLWNMEYLFYV